MTVLFVIEMLNFFLLHFLFFFLKLEAYVFGHRDAYIAAEVSEQQPETVVPIIARFISSCSTEQIRLAPDKFTRFLWYSNHAHSFFTVILFV